MNGEKVFGNLGIVGIVLGVSLAVDAAVNPLSESTYCAGERTEKLYVVGSGIETATGVTEMEFGPMYITPTECFDTNSGVRTTYDLETGTRMDYDASANSLRFYDTPTIYGNR